MSAGKDLFLKRGELVDTRRIRFLEQIKELKSQVVKLNRQGVLLAFPHYKKGSTTMYLLEPRNGDGKRKYHHIGQDSKDQKAAIAKIGRYHRRTAILEAIEVLELSKAQMDRDFTALSTNFVWSILQGEEALKMSAKFAWTWGDMEA